MKGLGATSIQSTESNSVGNLPMMRYTHIHQVYILKAPKAMIDDQKLLWDRNSVNHFRDEPKAGNSQVVANLDNKFRRIFPIFLELFAIIHWSPKYMKRNSFRLK